VPLHECVSRVFQKCFISVSKSHGCYAILQSGKYISLTQVHTFPSEVCPNILLCCHRRDYHCFLGKNLTFLKNYSLKMQYKLINREIWPRKSTFLTWGKKQRDLRNIYLCHKVIVTLWQMYIYSLNWPVFSPGQKNWQDRVIYFFGTAKNTSLPQKYTSQTKYFFGWFLR